MNIKKSKYREEYTLYRGIKDMIAIDGDTII